MNLEDYKNKFVAFVDILGFKKLIDNIESKSVTHSTDFKKVFSILNFLDEESKCSNGQHDLPVYEMTEEGMVEKELGNPVITYVSDCVVISTDGTFDGFKSLCNKLTKLSTDIATDGIFLRGAITYGKIFHTGRILFGSAYQNAFELESKKALNPRIIVDKSVLDFLKDKIGQFPLNNTGIRLDKSDNLSYLRLFPLNYFPYYTHDWLSFLLRVKSHLLYHLNMFDSRVSGYTIELRNLDKYCCWKEQYTDDLDFTGGNEAILKKYLWILDEFHETIETYSKYFSDENGKMRVCKISFDKIWKPEVPLGHWR